MTVLLVGVVVAVAAAARSTWSPCGLSMLSTITPFGERARRHRYGVTAGWFLAGSIAGGATLGGVAAGLAALVRLAGDSATAGDSAWLAAGAVVALAGALVDAGVFGAVLPLIRRQVDDRWLSRYRPWVYGLGFGWQIGVGFATYLMTAGVVVVAVLGALSGSPVVALALGLVFGAARGSTVFLTARASDPAALRALHARIDRLGPAVRRATTGAQVGGACGLGLGAANVVGAGSSFAGVMAMGLAMAFALAGVVGAGLIRGPRRRPAPSPAGSASVPSPAVPAGAP